jgi:60S ribosome subunit biogenesis protein NIP7
VLGRSVCVAGFGIAAQPTEYCKELDPTANVVLHQGDIGEYLRTVEAE